MPDQTAGTDQTGGTDVKSLSQKRAENALNASRIDGMGLGQKGGDALSGFPLLIKTDGLLATAAYAVERKSGGQPKQPGALLIMEAVAKHLHNLDIVRADNAKALIEKLSRSDDASLLRRATAESLAYLNYLKRFVD